MQDKLKNVLLIVIVLLAITASVFIFSSQKIGGNAESSSVPTSSSGEAASSSQKASSSVNSSSKPLSAKSELQAQIKAIDDNLNSDYLKLISQKSLLPDGFMPELVKISGSVYLIDKRVKPYLDNMLSDAKKAGYVPSVVSGYRTKSEQSGLYEKKITYFITNYKYSRAKAAIEAAKIVAPPNASEHQYGMTADIISKESLNAQVVEKTPLNKWFKSHCTNYGFIVRYPNSKTDITGVIYEPWHFRYVGKENAKAMTEQGLCLEEYRDKLVSQKAELQKQFDNLS